MEGLKLIHVRKGVPNKNDNDHHCPGASEATLENMDKY